MYVYIYISMVCQVFNYLWCQYSGWDHKRIIYLHTKMLSLLQWHTASYCTWTLLCRRLKLTRSNDLDSFYHLGTRVVVLFFVFLNEWLCLCFSCFVLFLLFCLLYSQVFELLIVQLGRRTQKWDAWRKERKKKRKMPSRSMSMFVHVPQPITNVTLKLH